MNIPFWQGDRFFGPVWRRWAARFASLLLAAGILASLLQASQQVPRADSSPVCIMLSMKIRPYENLAQYIAKGFKGFDTKVFYLDQDPGAAQKMRGLNPQMIITVGQDAFKKSLPNRGNSQLVYTMVLNPREVLPEPVSGVAGIAMVPSPKQEFLILQRGFRFKRVAIFYNPRASGLLLREIQGMVPEGIELVPVAVKNDAELLKNLDTSFPAADALMLVPDPTVLSEQSLKKLVGACFSRNVPMIGFSPIYLDLGAAATISVAEEDVARKAVALALKSDSNSADQVDDLHYLKNCLIHLNSTAGEKLKLRPDKEALGQFGRVVDRKK